MAGKKWSNEEIEYLKNNRFKKTFREIGIDIGRSLDAVKTKASKLGLKTQRKYYFDFSFFEKIDTEEKAYWLGFIFADGYVHERFNLLRIRLQRCDKEHLKKFNKSLNGNVPIVDYEQKYKNEKYKNSIMSSFSIRSKKTLLDLMKHGVFQGKSKKMLFPEINDKFIFHFIRGYFDGDGNLYANKKRKVLIASIVSGSYDFLIELKSILKKYEIESYMNKISKNAYKLTISGKKSTKKFLFKIYEKSNVFLNRKYKYYCNNKNLLEYIRSR